MRRPMMTMIVVLAAAWCCRDAADCRGCGADIGLLRAVPEDSTGLALVGDEGTCVRALRDPETAALTLAIDAPGGGTCRFEVGGGGYQGVDGGVVMGGPDAWTGYVAVSMLGAKTPVRLIELGKRDGRCGVFGEIRGLENVGCYVERDVAFAVVKNPHRVGGLEPAFGSQPLFIRETVYRLDIAGAIEVGTRLAAAPENVLARFAADDRGAGDREEVFQGETEDAAAAIAAGGTYQVRVDGTDVTYELASAAGVRLVRFREIGPGLWAVRLRR